MRHWKIMPLLDLNAKAGALQRYYETLEQACPRAAQPANTIPSALSALTLRFAFQSLLDHCAQQVGLTFKIDHQPQPQPAVAQPPTIIGLLVDPHNLVHGYWYFQTLADDLTTIDHQEIDDQEKDRLKLFANYNPTTAGTNGLISPGANRLVTPLANTLWQTAHHAVLYQLGQQVLHADLRQPQELIAILTSFFNYRRPVLKPWEKAIAAFPQQIPRLAPRIFNLIETEKLENPRFAVALTNFINFCRQTINSRLSDDAIQEMLVQHLLTAPIFPQIFPHPAVAKRNAIALEIEKLISTFTPNFFNNCEIPRDGDDFHLALAEAAATIEAGPPQQYFLNRVYERFFQSFSTNVADTHGIVYTPQSIVDFMVESVEALLQQEFGRSSLRRHRQFHCPHHAAN
jgi:hypothetical protein